jgi:hypothetical protein
VLEPCNGERLVYGPRGCPVKVLPRTQVKSNAECIDIVTKISEALPALCGRSAKPKSALTPESAPIEEIAPEESNEPLPADWKRYAEHC